MKCRMVDSRSGLVTTVFGVASVIASQWLEQRDRMVAEAAVRRYRRDR